MTTPTINDVKEFWDRRPCNVRHSAKPQGTREYFDEVESKKFRAEPHLVTFSDFPSWRGKKVLEIGCGIGTAAINFARNGAVYTGVELSDESLSLAKKRFEVYGQQGRFFQANAENLSDVVPFETYDLVYTWGVIHHTPNPGAVIRQAKRYMGPGTVLKVMVYASNSWKNYMIEAGFDQPEAQYGCPIAYTYTTKELVDMLGDDFDIIDITQDHIFPYQIEPYKQGEFLRQPWFESMPEEIFRVLERKLGWHLMLTARYKG